MKIQYTFLLLLWMSLLQNVVAQCPPGQTTFQVFIQPDQFYYETTWELTDSNGDVIFSGEVPSQNSYNFSDCIWSSSGCLTFTIYDSFGDGILDPGGYQVVVGGEEVASGSNFGSLESTDINCPPGTSCSNPLTANEGLNASISGGNSWFTFIPSQSGMYEITTCFGNNSCGNTTIYIYDYCTGLVWDNSNAGTVNYSDQDCSGALSFLQGAFAGGETYYIRILYDDAGCNDISLPWEINFAGEVSGCMDSNACNYSPLATSDDGSCIYPGDPNCPQGPDLIIVQDALVTSMYIDNIENNDACLIQEGCVSGYGTREIIRFTTHIKNIGDYDYYIGAPQANDQWEFDPCHNHWHYEGYAEYVLFDMSDGTEIPIGFKNGFCVMDLECQDGGNFQYNCSEQGISAHCGDIYDSGLQCQWIDITDIQAGEYMLVVKVNWDQSPDANGLYEITYDNNWAQVCIEITRDPVTNAASFNYLQECAPYEDCLGVLYGDAQPDCNGECAGVALAGDINVDTTRTTTDLTIYMLESLLDTMMPTPCYDLNDDGEITVTDATLLFDCLLHDSGASSAEHNHTPCQFPYAVSNPNDIATLTLAELNQDEDYIEIHIKNPTGKILSYEFDVSGIVIDYVTSLVPDFVPNVMFDENEIIGISTDEVPIDKNPDYIPFMRIYYTDITAEEICIANITDIVNNDYEEMAHEVDNACVTPQVVGIHNIGNNSFQARVIPNPISNTGKIIFNNNNDILSFEIFNISGKLMYSKENISESEINIPTQQLEAGIYIFKLYNKEKNSVGRFIVN